MVAKTHENKIKTIQGFALDNRLLYILVSKSLLFFKLIYIQKNTLSATNT